MLIGSVAGAIGGGVAGLAGKLAPSASRIATTAASELAGRGFLGTAAAAERATTLAIGKGGQAALGAGTQGASSNTLDYLRNKEVPHSVSGTLAAAGTGFGTGYGGSWASRGTSSLFKVSPWGRGAAHVTPS